MTTSVTSAELQAQFDSLRSAVDHHDLSASRACLRKVWIWASDRRADISVDVLSTIPITNPDGSVLRALLGLALLPVDGRQLEGTSHKLRNKILDLFEDVLTLQGDCPASFYEEMDGFFDAIAAFLRRASKARARRGFSMKADTSGREIQVLTTKLHNLETGIKKAVLTSLGITPSRLGSFPPQQPLIGRDLDVEGVFDHFAEPDSQGVDGHVAIVGVAGVGKSALARAVVAHPRASVYGCPTYVACNRLLTLENFQRELFFHLAGEPISKGEDPSDAVTFVLSDQDHFIILDNLLDSPSGTPDDYRQFLSKIADIPNLTLLITTRNQHLTQNFESTRRVYAYQLNPLSPDACEELFCSLYNRHPPCHPDEERNLADIEPFLPDFLNLLDGIPLAIHVAAEAAREECDPHRSLIHWKASLWSWNRGRRNGSLALSLELSLNDLPNDARTLLRLLCDLPLPVHLRHLHSAWLQSPSIRLAIDAAVERSIARVELVENEPFLTIIQPVRQYLSDHWPDINLNSEIIYEFTFGYFRIVAERKKREKVADSDNGNFLPLIRTTEGIVRAELWEARLQALLSCTWSQDEVELELLKLLDSGKESSAASHSLKIRIPDYVHLIHYRLRIQDALDTLALEKVSSHRLTPWESLVTQWKQAVKQAEHHGLHFLRADLLGCLADNFYAAHDYVKQELPPADLEGETRLRNIYDWSLGHTDIAFDVLSLIPLTAPFAPLVKLVIGVALLPTDGKAATKACRELKNRLVRIHLESLPLRDKEHKPIDDAMDESRMLTFHRILSELHAYITLRFNKTSSNTAKGLKSELVISKVQEWTNRVNSLQADYIVPSLRTMEDQLKDLTKAFERMGTNKTHILSRLEAFPPDPDLVGRGGDLHSVLELLNAHNKQEFTEHVALVGLGGIGKTSLAIKVAYHPQAKAFGRPVFIRCERLSSVTSFQEALIRLRAPDPLRPGEILADAVREELAKEPFLLILDNLLDTSDDSDTPYFEYISSLTNISSLTILITSRNHSFVNGFTARTIRPFHLAPLSPNKSKRLFTRQYGRPVSDQELPDLERLLQLLDGIPLAIQIVAVYARTAGPLATVINMWKLGEGWDNGTHGRLTSLDISLSLSFRDVAVAAPETMGLLRLLARLPSPIIASRGSPSVPISRAIKAVVERSVGQRDNSTGEISVRILEPVREYIVRHYPLLDLANEVVRALAVDYFRTLMKMKVSEEEQDNVNIVPLLKLTQGKEGDALEPERLHALLSCGWRQEETASELRIIQEVSIPAHIHLIQFRLDSQDNVPFEILSLKQAVEQAKQHKLEKIQCEVLVKLADELFRAGDHLKASVAYKQASLSCTLKFSQTDSFFDRTGRRHLSPAQGL
ncbi:hypothetical protein P7C70_g6528, partial [Phenoliferia sp. Uapishka_3]